MAGVLALPAVWPLAIPRGRRKGKVTAKRSFERGLATEFRTVTRSSDPGQEPQGVSLASYGGNWTTALAAAAAHPDKLLRVPSGTWPAPAIFPQAGVTIRGAGRGVTIVPRNAAQGGLDLNGFFHIANDDVVVEDMTIQGWPGTGTSDDVLIQVKEAARARIRRVRLEHAQGAGLYFWGAGAVDGLCEDVEIDDVVFRWNGAHGVGLWIYNGASFNAFKRISISNVNYSALFIDAGTETGPALSADYNYLEDVTVTNGSRSTAIGVGNGVQLTGSTGTVFRRLTVTDQNNGAAIGFGVDQSGLRSTENEFYDTTVSDVTSGDVINFGGQTGNVFDGGTGSGNAIGSAGNTIRNWPGLTLA